ncbi:DUF1810 domain-containing protein [Roseomonas sp. USHLN139]|uniref:DUF1810 domain-containing protein n=1 Tax=Roseomonas sp. USHLN139 TaxID=3081298 RepID=UPI003B01ACDA
MLDPQRFLDAQGPVLDTVRAELAAGRKRSHWMWFVFPQLRCLGRSPTALHYGLEDLDAARAYLDHPVLGARLVEHTGLVAGHPDRTVSGIFGSPDDLKFRSCMTLFAGAAPPAVTVFRDTLQQRFGGAGDPLTLRAIG